MQIIPVIDLKDGLVVHAVRGDRSHYRPIHLHSRLTLSSDVDSVLAGFLRLYPFDTFYIADLNAIMGDGDHHSLIDALLRHHPDLRFWVDNGAQISDIDTGRPSHYLTVIGTESQRSLPTRVHRDFILSLDFKQQQPAGDMRWFNNCALWPKDVIVMTLARVGSNGGPDFEKLAEFCAAHPDKNVVAAGGVRHRDDLSRLATMGVGGALLATSLHAGALSCREIADLQAKKYPGKPGYF